MSKLKENILVTTIFSIVFISSTLGIDKYFNREKSYTEIVIMSVLYVIIFFIAKTSGFMDKKKKSED